MPLYTFVKARAMLLYGIIGGATALATLTALLLPHQFPATTLGNGNDYTVFYAAGELMQAGRPIDAYIYPAITVQVSPHLEQSILYAAVSKPPAVADYPAFAYSPPTLLPLSVVANIPYELSLIIWDVLTVLFLGLAAWLVYKMFPRLRHYPFWAVLLLPLCLRSISISLLLGQTTVLNLILLITILYLSLLQHRHDVLTGVLLGVLILEKPQFSLGILLLWLMAGRWQSLVSCGLMVAGAFGLSLFFMPLETYRAWLDVLAVFSSYTPSQAPNLIYMIPLRTLLEAVLPLSHSVMMLLYYGLLVCLSIVLAWWLFQYRNAADKVGFYTVGYALAICYTLANAAHLVYYDASLVLLPATILIALEPKKEHLIALVMFVLLSWLTIPYFPRLLGWGLVLYMGYIVINLVRWAKDMLAVGSGVRVRQV